MPDALCAVTRVRIPDQNWLRSGQKAETRDSGARPVALVRLVEVKLNTSQCPIPVRGGEWRRGELALWTLLAIVHSSIHHHRKNSTLLIDRHSSAARPKSPGSVDVSFVSTFPLWLKLLHADIRRAIDSGARRARQGPVHYCQLAFLAANKPSPCG
ncbi:hypothetical protein IAQ61_005690 [Plenodomus lingam]|uniref:uncharacterized protein n=1 Tax=Leptosphaeria maculans TaxID=5022 RepID=UPI0033250988|nr:hypothetical protein IAQ61_005690 [Plenodomus lingam]